LQSDSARIAAATAILDRGYGSQQKLHHLLTKGTLTSGSNSTLRTD